MTANPAPGRIDAIDRRLIRATQDGLPLCPRPYHAIAAALGFSAAEVMARMRRLQEAGVIRRIGAVPNHYRLGYRANGMSVWDVPDEAADQLGRRIAAFEFVTHCYRRARRPPVWPYNLFAMVHGRSREEVEDKVARLAEALGEAVRGHDLLYSTRILKKTGLRLAD